MTRGYERAWWGARRGQVMPVFALILVVLMGAAALGIDLSRVRAEAESAQRAANAAALAGVVYLPDFKDSAYTRASAEARKNGYLTGQKSVIVTPSTVPGYGGRLKVTINEPAPSIFGHALGIFPQTISRSATAEYDQPLQLGAPDYVLGYAPFPTALVSSAGAYQGFYLAQRGRYDSPELGDAYSPYYESFQGKDFGFGWGNANGNYNACAPVYSCTGLTKNPDRPANFKGYDYVVDDPLPGKTLVIKLFDPYDENNFNSYAGASNKPGGTSLNGTFGTKMIDGGGDSTLGEAPTTLEFSLSGPYQTADDTSNMTVKDTPTSKGLTTCQATANCVVSWPFDAGEDPAYLWCEQHGGAGSCPGNGGKVYSPYAFKFMNYAIIHGPGIFHLHVESVTNVDPFHAGKEGTHLNQFGIAVCGSSAPSLSMSSANPSGSTSAYPYKDNPATSPSSYPDTSDPDSSSASNFWDGNRCPSPNAGTACTDPLKAAPGTCVHVYAYQRMCIHNQLNGGSKSLIPLGYVPSEYDGKTLQLHLYDVGDTGQDGPQNTIEVLTPAGDLTYYNGALNNTFPSSLNYSYSATPTDNPGSGYPSFPETSQSASQPLVVSSPRPAYANASGFPGYSWGRFNGSWLTVKVPITGMPPGKTYTDMVNQFGGFWKILYDMQTPSTDTTTWEVSVNGAPVHLISAT